MGLNTFGSNGSKRGLPTKESRVTKFEMELWFQGARHEIDVFQLPTNWLSLGCMYALFDLIRYCIFQSDKGKFQNGMNKYFNKIAFLRYDAKFYENFSLFWNRLNLPKYLQFACNRLPYIWFQYVPGKPIYFILFVHLIFTWQLVLGNCVTLKIAEKYNGIKEFYFLCDVIIIFQHTCNPDENHKLWREP